MVGEQALPDDIRRLADQIARWCAVHEVGYEELLDRVRHELDEEAREATRAAVEEAFA